MISGESRPMVPAPGDVGIAIGAGSDVARAVADRVAESNRAGSDRPGSFACHPLMEW